MLVKKYWNLSRLFVAPSVQRRGIGGHLLTLPIATCSGKSPRGAVLPNSAPAAIPFYTRHGFARREPTRALPPGYAAMELSF